MQYRVNNIIIIIISIIILLITNISIHDIGTDDRHSQLAVSFITFHYSECTSKTFGYKQILYLLRVYENMQFGDQNIKQFFWGGALVPKVVPKE